MNKWMNKQKNNIKVSVLTWANSLESGGYFLAHCRHVTEQLALNKLNITSSTTYIGLCNHNLLSHVILLPSFSPHSPNKQLSSLCKPPPPPSPPPNPSPHRSNLLADVEVASLPELSGVVQHLMVQFTWWLQVTGICEAFRVTMVIWR